MVCDLFDKFRRVLAKYKGRLANCRARGQAADTFFAQKAQLAFKKTPAATVDRGDIFGAVGHWPVANQCGDMGMAIPNIDGLQPFKKASLLVRCAIIDLLAEASRMASLRE